MADVSAGNPSNVGAPSSPASISKDSTRRGYLGPGHPEQELPLPTPSSPPIRLKRKRRASLALRGANDPQIESLALSNVGLNGPASLTKEQICLCQKDPKIPRPRNAFILYRQHYHNQVAAQNPGVANPEISKILGEQWRKQTPEVKYDWKLIAEEEKQLHQQKYPGYRYQPRRAGKPNPLQPIASSTSDDPTRCPKCGGRYISTPHTNLIPSGPQALTVDMGAGRERLPPPVVTSRANNIDCSRYEAQNSRMDTPRMALPYATNDNPYLQPLPRHQERDEDMGLTSLDHGQKRRRYNGEPPQGCLEPPTTYGPSQMIQNGGRPPPSAGGYRQPPTPGMVSRSGAMGPLPPHSAGPQHPQQRHQLSNRSSTMLDESLRLPPLNITASSSNLTGTQRPDQCDIQAGSVEAMVMTIPYLFKINLEKICGPLASPGVLSPAQETRGAVVAVESAHPELLSEVGNLLHNILSKDASCSVKVWSTSSTLESQGKPIQMRDAQTEAQTSESSDAPAKDPFMEYLSLIQEWHKKSQEMIKHITTTPTLPVPESSTPPSITSSRAVPVALIPSGFSLSKSDTNAHRIPINDRYSPIDHWKWMATLWRGIVGPDLTIYVDCVSREELDRCKDVEIRGDCNAMVVRVLEGEKLEERTMRRLGFEVSEFARMVGAGCNRGLLQG